MGEDIGIMTLFDEALAVYNARKRGLPMKADHIILMIALVILFILALWVASLHLVN